MKQLLSLRVDYHQYVIDCMEVCEVPVSFRLWFETAYYHDRRDDIIREVYGNLANITIPNLS